MILILEDDAQRIEAFSTVARLVAPSQPIRFWNSAHQMKSDLTDLLEHASVLSLDHDLVMPDGEDAGDGYELAQFLGQLIPCCPVIIHTSNGEGGRRMIGELTRGGWSISRVYPFGEGWIQREWKQALERCLGEVSR